VTYSDTQRWQHIFSVFEQVLEAPVPARDALLEQLCAGDEALRREVVELIAADDTAPRFEAGVLDARRAAAMAWTEEGDEPRVQPGDRVGPWRVSREIGVGGMGVVWLAERADGQFEQRVALKLIRRGLNSEAVHRRFLRERQILARLQHPHIAHLIDGGITADGSPYFAMEYVEGLPLLKYCRERNLGLEGRLRVFLDICAAVQFAHEHQVVHRDLKPSNVLVTREAGVKLLDFGIAKLFGDTAGVETITQLQREQPMTPAYAAPEQLRGDEVTPASDVYALGCVLYELLTDRHVREFKHALGQRDLLAVIENEDPRAPSRVGADTALVPARQLRGNLDMIVLTALRREPERRYASVAALAADLQNHLAGNAIAARREQLAHRAVVFMRRHRAGSAAGLAVVLTVAAIVIVGWLTHPFTPAIPENAALAIVDFHNMSQDREVDWIAPALAEMLGTELAQGSRMHQLPDDLVRSARRDLGSPAAAGYSAKSLAMLRKRIGTDYVLSGSYRVSGAPDDKRLRVDLALQDARDGTAIATVAQSGKLSDLNELVDHAGAALRKQAGYPALTPNEEHQTDEARPPSVEVARALGTALEALHKFDAARAKDELLNIVATEPGYAPAYLYLAQAWKQLGYDAKALANAQQAAAYSEGLPADMRRRIAHEVAVQKADWPHAIELDRQSLDADATNAELHLALVDDLMRAGKWADVDVALERLRQLPDSADDPRVDLRAAGAAQGRSDPQRQLAFASQALNKALARDEPASAAKAKYSLAQATAALGRLTDAQSLFREAVAEFQRNGNPQGEANAHLELANIADRSNAPQIARTEYEEARKIYQRIGDAVGLEAIYRSLMLVLLHAGDRDAAEAAARRALEIRRETGNSVGEGRIVNSLAFMRLDESASDEVMQQFRDALAMNQRDGSKSATIYTLKNTSEALRLRGELDAAASTCATALGEAQKLTYPTLRIVAGQQCAAVALTRGEVDRARQLFAEALSAAGTINDARTHADIDTALAAIDFADGDYTQARQRLTTAIDRVAPSETIGIEALAQSMLARTLLALRDAPGSERAATRARALRSRMTGRLEVFGVDLLLEQLRGDLGERAPALAALRELARDAEQRHWMTNALEARLAMLPMLDAMGDAKAAATLRRDLSADAKKCGCGWINARLQTHRSG
jgi:serine/threonine-protein kinase